jgi:acetyl-CoA synthetase
MSDIDVLLQENRSFPPPAEFAAKALVHDARLHDDAGISPETFWANEAGTLEWMQPWDTVCEWTPPHAKWFTGGKLNVSVNCIDRHIHGPRRNKAALIWEGEPGDRRTWTYWDLYREVNLAANMLKKLGVTKGDRVAIYMPMIAEAVIAMLACARIGAIHTVVFGGFSPDSLRDRINDCGCKVLITADGGYRRGQTVPLKRNADEALTACPTI